MTSVERVAPVDVRGILDEPMLAEPPLEVYCRRMERLLEAGYTLLVADALAQDPAVDVRKAVDLLSARSPYQVAARTLARWTQVTSSRLSGRKPVGHARGREHVEGGSGWQPARRASRPRDASTATARFLRSPLA
jgi:hypothetical protein